MNNKKFINLSLDLNLAFAKFGEYFETISPGSHLEGLSPAKIGHMGTHIDIMDKKEINERRFISKAYLIDVKHMANSEINIQDTNLGNLDIEKGDSVIFRTGWLDKTFDQNPISNYFENHPYFSYEIIDFLIEKEVNFIGMDSPGARRGREHVEVDQYCADHDVFIVENIVNLAELNDKDTFSFYCFPVKMNNLTGLTCRAIAIQ